ncbi:MAG TPA: hypothetical protein VIU38_05120 [Anaerolineales bacterium]
MARIHPAAGTPAMVEKRHLKALRAIIEALQDSTVAWAVTGSLGMVLQGMDLQVHDIDIQTDEDGAYEIERRLSEFMVQPILYKASARMRSRLGKFAIEGIQVEVIGAIQKRLQDGSWEPPVQVPAYRRWVDVGALRVPVLSLEYEYQAYLLMGRDEKAGLIKSWLDKHGAT